MREREIPNTAMGDRTYVRESMKEKRMLFEPAGKWKGKIESQRFSEFVSSFDLWIRWYSKDRFTVSARPDVCE